MKEITVKISNGKIGYKDKTDGLAKEMGCVVLEFPNGKTTNLISNRFNYRVYDYLTDLINGK
jgi:hypothetical protein